MIDDLTPVITPPIALQHDLVADIRLRNVPWIEPRWANLSVDHARSAQPTWPYRCIEQESGPHRCSATRGRPPNSVSISSTLLQPLDLRAESFAGSATSGSSTSRKRTDGWSSSNRSA